MDTIPPYQSPPQAKFLDETLVDIELREARIAACQELKSKPFIINIQCACAAMQDPPPF